MDLALIAVLFSEPTGACMRRWILCFLIFGVLMNPFYCHAAGNDWVWIQVSTLTNRYETFEGKAEVTFEGNKFVAKLYHKEQKDFLVFTINGEINDGKVNAKVLFYSSGAANYTGQYQKVRKEKNAIKTYETFALTDGHDFIGISRAY